MKVVDLMRLLAHEFKDDERLLNESVYHVLRDLLVTAVSVLTEAIKSGDESSSDWARSVVNSTLGAFVPLAGCLPIGLVPPEQVESLCQCIDPDSDANINARLLLFVDALICKQGGGGGGKSEQHRRRGRGRV